MTDYIKHICSRLQERDATLFLGAGINYGIKNSESGSFPLGEQLSEMICRDVLRESGLHLTLDEAAEIARFKVGARELNQFLSDRFSAFEPGLAHLSLVQLPWDVIYTTNYDLLVERAAERPGVGAFGKVAPVFSTTTDLSSFTEDDILYYKLHGSIDKANTEDGRLILTKDDYRYYELHRKPLFKRLKSELQSRSFVFVGYSLGDPNFRSILEDCRTELGTQTLPLSFAIRRSFAPAEESFWREKYNIQLIDQDGSEFLSALRDAWVGQQFRVTPLDVRSTKLYENFDADTRFEKVVESFYRIRPDDCTGPSNAKRFFSGREPSWNDIRDDIAPPRTLYNSLFESIFPAIADPSLKHSSYLVTGAAGTGKTTLIRTLALGLSRLGVMVLVYIPDTPLEARHLGTLVNKDQLERIIIVIHHASERIQLIDRFLADSQQLGIPVTLILEERKNQWDAASVSNHVRIKPEQFVLGSLDRGEIDQILKALNKYDALDKLTGTSYDFQLAHFTALADKELLVALRELTTNNSFDDIVRDEFIHIPSEKARLAYIYVAMLGVVNLAVRYETLLNLLNLRADELSTEIFAPTEGVLITGEESGSSRHSAGFTIRARHPIIASVIFTTAAPDDDKKLELLNSLLVQLDPGYAQDRRVLETLVRNRELSRMFASPEKRRGIYERLANILPGDPFVLQHRAILERELGDADLSVRYAREAVRLNSMNQSFLNTLGLALELQSREADEMKRQVFLFEANRLFEDNIRYDSNSAFGYIGKAAIIKNKYEREPDTEKKGELLAEGLALLDDALEFTDESPMVAAESAWFRRKLGELGDIVDVVRNSLAKNQADVRLRRMLIQFETDAGHLQEAVRIGMEGIKYSPTSWLLNRDIARLKRSLGEPTTVVKGFFETAVRHNKGDLSLAIEFGSFLFERGNYAEYTRLFRDIDLLPAAGNEKTRIRSRVRQGTSLKTFKGTVKLIRGATAYVSLDPEGVDVFFWLSDNRLRSLRERNRVTCHIGFNSKGAIAFDVDRA